MHSQTLRSEPRLADASFHRLLTHQCLRHTDCDDQGHVNNGVIVQLFDDGRVRMLHPAVGSQVPEGAIFALATQQIDYHAELNYPGDLTVGTTVLALGNSSVSVGQGLFDETGTCVATASSVTVLLDHQNGPTSWPDGARQAFGKFTAC